MTVSAQSSQRATWPPSATVRQRSFGEPFLGGGALTLGAMPVGYFHLVFTLPGPIADIAHHNKAAIYGLLFTAAAEATLTIAADPKRLGARIGITAVLHSWGSAMTHHPHVHMIVPGGGISLDHT